MKFQLLTLIILLFVACNSSKTEQKLANEICICFKNYNENNRLEMENTINCLDSLEKQFNSSYSLKNLLKQVDKQCPNNKEVINELIQETKQ